MSAIDDIIAERKRQIEVEGWSTAQDDARYIPGELALAGACYAAWNFPVVGRQVKEITWPWDEKWFKPKNARRDLVRAAALLIAEIERIDRQKVKESNVISINKNTQELVSGKPVPQDRSHEELKANGQQQDYVVLTKAERDKGFVRPVRTSYQHIGASGPRYSLRELTEEEHERYDKFKYHRFETYPESDSPAMGRFWTLEQLNKIGRGCHAITTMGDALAETYARNPKFYGGTFCCGCGTHFPLEEFVWYDTNERVGS